MKENGYKKTLVLRYEPEIPTGTSMTERNSETCIFPIQIEISLERRKKRIDIRCCMKNEAEDHRVRMRIRSDINTKYTSSLTSYELKERRLGEGHFPGYRGPDQPNSGLIYLEDAGERLAIYNRGLHEYEHASENGDVLLTLLRSTGTITSSPEKECGADWTTPDGECKREISAELALEFGAEKESAVSRMNAVRNPVLWVYDSADGRKFFGGRPALQTTDLDGLFFREDEWKGIEIADGASVLRLVGKGITVTAFKREEHGNGHILRVFNTGCDKTNFKIFLPSGTKEAYKTELSEERKDALDIINENVLELAAEPHEIYTLYFR
ncbi:MAG: hypothetical protein E7623_02085 [Ruminococcaceae bacterium]|nr:hypothetical protein [Oscillospiraceae bacterium]